MCIIRRDKTVVCFCSTATVAAWGMVIFAKRTLVLLKKHCWECEATARVAMRRAAVGRLLRKSVRAAAERIMVNQ